MPSPRILTRNRMGWSSQYPSGISQQFVEFASGTQPLPVLDIGAGYGAAALAALRGGATVIANDLDAATLDELQSRAPSGDQGRLILRTGHFPRDLHFETGSLSAVHASNVLHFLTGNQLAKGLRDIARWLAPGGKLFVQAATPYQAPFAAFIPEYEQRLAVGTKWPGWVTKISEYSDHRQLSQMPRSIHLLDDRVLCRAAEDAGLAVEQLSLGRRPDLPASLHWDGRETVAMIAVSLGG